jgi:hypothetical protein
MTDLVDVVQAEHQFVNVESRSTRALRKARIALQAGCHTDGRKTSQPVQHIHKDSQTRVKDHAHIAQRSHCSANRLSQPPSPTTDEKTSQPDRAHIHQIQTTKDYTLQKRLLKDLGDRQETAHPATEGRREDRQTDGTDR